MENTTILSMQQVADRIGRSLDTLRYWRQLDLSRRPGDKQHGPASFKLGRRVVYAESDLIAWIDEQRRIGGIPQQAGTTDRATA